MVSETEPTGRARLRRFSALCLAVCTGVGLVCQNGINTNLRQTALIDPFLTACASFAVGLACISILALTEAVAAGKPCCSHVANGLRNAPWYAFTGGLLGPTYVVAAVLLPRILGFAIFQLCATIGQLGAALIVDRIGLVRLHALTAPVLMLK